MPGCRKPPGLIASAVILPFALIGPAHALPAPAPIAVTEPAPATPLLQRVVSRIGYWRAKRTRAEMRRYRGNPAAQQILKQKRENLCRNTPEMC